MNELLFIITVLFNFGGILLFYKLFGKKGLFGWVCLGTVIANIEVLKSIDMFGMSMTLGNVIYGTTFLATDILSEKYGGKESRKAVIGGILSMVVFTIAMQLSLLYTPNAQDFASDAMNLLFSLTPRICAGSLIAFAISSLLDTYFFEWIKSKLPSNKWLWIRNNGSTLLSQLIDTTIFTSIAFIGIYDINTVISIGITTYIAKIIISLLDTPFIYLAKKIKPRV